MGPMRASDSCRSGCDDTPGRGQGPRNGPRCRPQLGTLLGLLLAALVLLAPSTRADTLAASPVGEWRTVDDHTGQPRAIVRLYEAGGRLFGRIEQSFTPGAEHRRCEVCTDERKDQPIIGLLIIRNLEHRDGEWSGGDILDPDSGRVYRCKLHLDDQGRLVVRGFIGISLLGRTQIWSRPPAR